MNFTEEGRDLVSSGGMKVFDLINYIDVDDSSKHIYDKLIEVGLGELTIVDVSRERKWYTNGFQALTVKDEHNNAGIVYRGSDFEWNRGALDDWFNANIKEFFNNTSEQVWYAKFYFLKNRSEDGTYLFGHSLGGNLSM